MLPASLASPGPLSAMRALDACRPLASRSPEPCTSASKRVMLPPMQARPGPRCTLLALSTASAQALKSPEPDNSARSSRLLPDSVALPGPRRRALSFVRCSASARKSPEPLDFRRQFAADACQADVAGTGHRQPDVGGRELVQVEVAAAAARHGQPAHRARCRASRRDRSR